MTKKQLIEKVRKDADNKINVLRQLPKGLPIAFMSALDSVWMQANAYEENMKTLHQIRAHCGNYKMGSYWYSCGSLLVRYCFQFNNNGKHFDVVLDFNDPVETLKKISNGKCSLQDKPQPPEKEVVCDVE